MSWWKQKRNLNAVIERKHFQRQEMPTLFFTGTYAQYYWPEVRRLLRLAALEDGNTAMVVGIDAGKILVLQSVFCQGSE